MQRIDAEGIPYRELNDRINGAVRDGEEEFILDNIRGQRYIGAGLGGPVRITINGTAGADLASFMDGAEITVNGNAQAGVANTMNSGKIVIHGDAGDIMGYSMRGGRLFVRGSVGYRAGIHMKAYQDRMPRVVIGGSAGDYLGEYMAGGVLVVLGMDEEDGCPLGEYAGTGMHGGTIFVRGEPQPWQLGAEVGQPEIDDDDWQQLQGLLEEFCAEFDLDPSGFGREEFTKMIPVSERPYGRLYAY
jgi:glutamate synthase domain-containing protein 3